MSSSSRSTVRRRTHVVAGLAAAVGMLGVVPAVSSAAATTDAPAVAPATAAPVAVPGDVSLFRTNTSLLGEHRWYRQVLGGHPVVGGMYAQHEVTVGAEAGRVTVWDGRVPVGTLAATDATVSSAAAIDAALARTGGIALTYAAPSLWVLPGTETRLVWLVSTQTDGEVGQSHATYVDAVTGAVLKTEVESHSDSADEHGEDGDEGKWVTGSAKVFDPNPIAKLQDQSLTDDDDADSAVPNKAYSTRKLKNLDKSNTLVGRWARLVNSDLASEPDNVYNYKRSDDDFEQVMSYYSLDTQQQYYQELGFTDVNAESQKIQSNGISADNSYYSPAQDLIVTGTGGVDDSEDPEVVWHEAGHATQDAQVPGFGVGNEAGAIGEAYGDYIAVALSQKYAKDTETVPAWCVMDWDAVSYSGGPIHCLRTTQEDKHYPEDLQQQVHADGEIWSQALYEMNLALGRDKATTAIVEAQFSFAPNVTMPEAAELTVKATKDLYGAKAAKKATKAFKARGLL